MNHYDEIREDTRKESNVIIDENSTLDVLGEIIRVNNFKLAIIYGSGGYCTQITSNGKQFISFSNDIYESVEKALQKAFVNKNSISNENVDTLF